MGDKRLFPMVLITLMIISIVGMHFSENNDRADVFTGICVKRGEGYSILYNTSETLLIPETLEIGKVYGVSGKLYTQNGYLRISSRYSIEMVNSTPEWTEELEGAYWTRKGRPYLLTPEWIKLSGPIPVPKGARIRVWGVKYGSKFYPIGFKVITQKPKEMEDGFPALVEGTVLGRFNSKNSAVLWTGREKVYVYLPYGQSLSLGLKVKVLGRVSLSSRPYIYVDNPEDITVEGYPEPVSVNGTKTGTLTEARCAVIAVQKSGLRLNCTSLKLSGITAKTGDTVEFLAVNTGSSLKCINCQITRRRENLPNGICNFREGSFARIHGVVKWVKRYRNGFGLANITREKCWILLKLPKSLGVNLSEGDAVSAYGTFTLYRGKQAFEVNSGDDVCSGEC